MQLHLRLDQVILVPLANLSSLEYLAALGKKMLLLKPNEICPRNRQDSVVCLPSQLLRVI
jgi:hypothetical protein